MLASQGSSSRVQVLGPADLSAALALLAEDPVPNVFVDYRTRLTSLDPRWLGGEMWGYLEEEHLVSMCHVGANLIPVQATRDACAAFVDRALQRGRTCTTIVGLHDPVAWLWEDLAGIWDEPRDERWDQPHMELSAPPAVEPDTAVRRTPESRIEDLYPACVAMYTEEVGVSPESGGGRQLYRARVSQLVHRGWSFSRIENGTVLFKAEVACVTEHAAQVQGVYVDPSHRGEGLCSRGMAAVVETVLAEIAPTVSLYVNAHNLSARAAYEKVGFKQTHTFSTLMF